MTSTPSNAIDICKLPEKIREKLAQLDLELTEGDITEKGYEKKRRELLEPFFKKSVKQEPNKKEERIQKQRRRTTRTETRYHSEIRQEAVHQALAKINLNNNCFEQQDNEQNNLNVLTKEKNNFQNCLSFRQRLGSRSRRRITGAQTSDSSSDDENDLMLNREEGNSDSGTSGSNKNKKYHHRDKKIKEDKVDDEKEEEKKGEDQIDGKKLQNYLLNGKNIFSSSLKDEFIPQNIKNKDYNKNLQQKYNYIEETTGYISMLQMNNTQSFEPKPGSSQQFQQQISEQKNIISSPILLKQQQQRKENINNNINNLLPPNSSPIVKKNLNNNNEKREEDYNHHPISFLRRRNGENNNKNNNNIKLQNNKSSQVANRTSVLLLEDRPLPQLPLLPHSINSDDNDEIEEDNERPEEEELEESEELPVYVNSTNDSGLGGSSSAPKDYANCTKTPTKPTRVSEKIQQVLHSLQTVSVASEQVFSLK